MKTVELKNKIFEKLITVEDSSMLETVLDYVENLKKTEPTSSNITKKQLDELDKRREQYLLGKEKTYSWKQVKQELIDNYGLQT
ncbi:MAG: hypothetical protein ACPG44_05565 [Polaribacter sp.]